MAGSDKGESDRFECLERRLQALEDIEAIRNLKARYAALCDDHYDADGIAELFSEDAIWESPTLGHFEGREMIRIFSGVLQTSFLLLFTTVSTAILKSVEITLMRPGIFLCRVLWEPTIKRCGALV